jgi:hypothetical protein
MGVTGLHNYIIRSACPCQKLIWPLNASSDENKRKKLLIDGNAFAYYVYFKHLNWTCGGKLDQTIQMNYRANYILYLRSIS